MFHCTSRGLWRLSFALLGALFVHDVCVVLDLLCADLCEGERSSRSFTDSCTHGARVSSQDQLLRMASLATYIKYKRTNSIKQVRSERCQKHYLTFGHIPQHRFVIKLSREQCCGVLYDANIVLQKMAIQVIYARSCLEMYHVLLFQPKVVREAINAF